jgi:hypothetical protein
MANVTAEEKIMGKGLYGTPEMVKAFREHYIKEDGELPDFLETLELMKEKGALSTEELPVPELHGRMSKEDFMKAYDQVPFDAEKLMQIARVCEGSTIEQGCALKINVTVDGKTSEAEETVLLINGSWVFSDCIDVLD